MCVFDRKIALTLSLPQRRRGSCIDFVTACRTEYDRLCSSTISIPQSQIKRFKEKFKSVHHTPEVVTGGIGTISRHGDITDVQPQEAGHRRGRRASVILQDVIINPIGQIPRHHVTQAPPPPTRPRLPLDVRRPSAEDIVSGGESSEASKPSFALGKAPTLRFAPAGMAMGDEQYQTQEQQLDDEEHSPV